MSKYWQILIHNMWDNKPLKINSCVHVYQVKIIFGLQTKHVTLHKTKEKKSPLAEREVTNIFHLHGSLLYAFTHWCIALLLGQLYLCNTCIVLHVFHRWKGEIQLALTNFVKMNKLLFELYENCCSGFECNNAKVKRDGSTQLVFYSLSHLQCLLWRDCWFKNIMCE